MQLDAAIVCGPRMKAEVKSPCSASGEWIPLLPSAVSRRGDEGGKSFKSAYMPGN